MHLSCDNLVTWSKHQKTHWMVAFTINTHLVNFGSHRPRRLGDISLFISHVTSWGHLTKGSSLPSVVAIRLLEVEIWPILIFNVRRRMNTYGYLITKFDNSNSQAFLTFFVLQSAAKQYCYYKVRQVLQSMTDFNTKYVRYCKVRQLLQSET